MPDRPATATVDHLVWAAEDLDAGVLLAEQRLGVRAVHGGSHPGMGTRNALLGLGLGCYLEVLAPDPAQPGLRDPMGGWIPGSGRGRLARWAARSGDLDRVAVAARDLGLTVNGPLRMTRDRPGGARLAWRIVFLDDPGEGSLGPLLPFFLDWGTSPHPSEVAPAGCTLQQLRGEHPEPDRATGILASLGVTLPVAAGPRPALHATIRTPSGETTELR